MAKKVKIYYELQSDHEDIIFADMEDFDGEPDEEQAQRMVDDHVRKNVVGLVKSFKVVER